MKKIIVVSILILSLCMTLMACNGDKGSDTNNNSDPITQGKKIVTPPSYTLISERNDSIANTKRYVYNIVINESVSDEQLTTLFGFMDKPDFDEVVVFIYKDKASANSGKYSIIIERAGNNNPVVKRK